MISPSRISKTNVLGVLEFATAIIVGLAALPPKAGVAVIALAVLRAAIRFLQTDADLLPAGTPGNPTPDPQPAHPVPDDPSLSAR